MSGATIDVTSPAKLRSGVIAIRDGQTEDVPDLVIKTRQR